MKKNNVNLSKVISSDRSLILLALFNSAMVMNFDFIVWNYPIFLFAVFLFFLNSIVIVKWWLSVVIVFVSLYQLIPHFPRMANHCNILLFIEVVVLGVFFLRFVKPKEGISGDQMSNLFRVTLVSIYFWAGFSKLNMDFFNPCISCVNRFHEMLLYNFTGQVVQISSGLSKFLQYLTIILELIVPFGLFWKRTRLYTVIALLGFHFYLNFITFYSFSALAVFLVFGSLYSDFDVINKKVKIGLKVYLISNLIVLLLNSWFKSQGSDLAFSYFILGIIYNAGLLCFSVPLLISYKVQKTKEGFKPLWLVYFIIPAIIIWNLKSYIGLGNSGNLTMFSNLITESSRSNHILFNTHSTKIVDWEEDKVEILSLSDTLSSYELEGYTIPVIEFNYLTSEWSKQYNNPLRAVIVHHTDTLRIEDLSNSKYNSIEWWYKYVPFRKVRSNGDSPCVW
ncbi:MAG: hypothetical protein H6584_09055 [Flavobacteriales bacterium]|nr:hypothetical protein [Flavobacteriales bacterium]